MLQRCGRIDTVNTIIFQIKVRKKIKNHASKKFDKNNCTPWFM